jgi:hypothetical protein
MGSEMNSLKRIVTKCVKAFVERIFLTARRRNGYLYAELIRALSDHGFTQSHAGFSPNDQELGETRFLLQHSARFIPKNLQSVSNLIADSLKLPPSLELSMNDSNEETIKIAEIFNQAGTDKSREHSYEFIYSRLKHAIENRSFINVFEIGIGSTNPLIPYSMQIGSKELAGLNAWSQLLPNAQCFGADIDAELISRCDQDRFFEVDQTSMVSLENLLSKFENRVLFDLIIDDGLHELHANLNTVSVLFKLMKPQSFYVIEDIHESSVDLLKIGLTSLNFKFDIFDLSNIKKAYDDNYLAVIYS